MAFVWSVLKERAADLLAGTDESLCQELEQISGSTLGALQMSGDKGVWPLQLAEVDRWIGSKQGKAWALAGDAAHTVHPLAGQGWSIFQKQQKSFLV